MAFTRLTRRIKQIKRKKKAQIKRDSNKVNKPQTLKEVVMVPGSEQ